MGNSDLTLRPRPSLIWAERSDSTSEGQVFMVALSRERHDARGGHDCAAPRPRAGQGGVTTRDGPDHSGVLLTTYVVVAPSLASLIGPRPCEQQYPASSLSPYRLDTGTADVAHPRSATTAFDGGLARGKAQPEEVDEALPLHLDGLAVDGWLRLTSPRSGSARRASSLPRSLISGTGRSPPARRRTGLRLVTPEQESSKAVGLAPPAGLEPPTAHTPGLLPRGRTAHTC